MSKKLLFLLSFCLILPVSAILAQEKETVTETEKARTEEVKQVETKRESETKPNNNSSKSDNSSRNNSSSTSNERSSKREDSDSGRDKTPKKDRDAEERQPNKRGKDNDDEDLRQPKRPERPPVDNPNPPVNNPDNPVVNPNPNPPPVDNNNNNQGRNRDRDKDDKDRDDKDRDDKKRHRNRNGGWGGGYPYPSNYPTSVPSNPAPPFSMRDYFDKDDVFFDIYDSYIEKAENYLPFFDSSPSLAFQPLYYAYGRKFFNNEFPWVSNSWTIYYEPDLDDIFVDFTTLGNVKYERMVMYPIGDTIKKVNKKFDYKGSDLRPVLVEKIPDMEQDKVYSFNVHDLPKGDYELRFIAKNGATVRHSIRLK